MCTSFVLNKKNTIVGFNLDILDMEWKVFVDDEKVAICILDAKQGWLPLFGVNRKGNFVSMPTCWPYDKSSDPTSETDPNIIMLDIDLLLDKKSFIETKEFVLNNKIYSMPSITYQAQLSDKNGNALIITPGQGVEYKEKPEYSILTNFSPFKLDRSSHPWMGVDRYDKAKQLLEKASDDFTYLDGMKVLEETSQVICPTVVSMIYDNNNNTVYWCENRDYNNIFKKVFYE